MYISECKPPNVITVNVICRLMWSQFEGPIYEKSLYLKTAGTKQIGYTL